MEFSIRTRHDYFVAWFQREDIMNQYLGLTFIQTAVNAINGGGRIRTFKHDHIITFSRIVGHPEIGFQSVGVGFSVRSASQFEMIPSSPRNDRQHPYRNILMSYAGIFDLCITTWLESMCSALGRRTLNSFDEGCKIMIRNHFAFPFLNSKYRFRNFERLVLWLSSGR